MEKPFPINIGGMLKADTRTRHAEEFKTLDRRMLFEMDDKGLASWQHKFEPDEPQWRLAEYEWQRRLTAEQIKATIFSARWQAWFGIAAVFIGMVLVKLLELLK